MTSRTLREKFYNVCRKRKLSDDLKALVCRPDVVNSMSGYTLEERCKLIHRLKSDESLSRKSLLNIFKAADIRHKVIKKVKLVPKKSKQFSDSAILYCKRRLTALNSAGIPVVYVDEGMVTRSTWPQFDYNLPYCNTQLSPDYLNQASYAFIVGLSLQGGVVQCATY